MTDFWTHVNEIFSVAWSYKISLIPVLVTYLLFDFPAIVRKLTGIAYVPIYFLILPLGHSDQLYAEYLNEDDFYGVGKTMTPAEKKTLRRKIQATAVISMVFAAVVAPWLCGFISAFYLQPQQFTEFLVFLFVVKLYLIAKSLWNLRQESRAAMHFSAFMSVIGIYVMYLVFVWHGLNKSFIWTSAHLNSRGLSGLAIALGEYAYQDLIINVGIVAALTWAFNVKLTDPENITRVDEYVDEPAAPS
jgi:hypothetical protein